tara:strand:- start:415 stop:582 length:168 start_codon:yes stop_codon:yes gene_type:complete
MNQDPFDQAVDMAKKMLVFIDKHGINPSDVDYMWNVAQTSLDADKEYEAENKENK